MTSSRKWLISVALLGAVIASGLAGRWALDYLMVSHPENANLIDVIGQGLIGLVIVWLCFIPFFRIHGIIEDRGRDER